MTKKEKQDLFQIAEEASKEAGQAILGFYGKEYNLRFKEDNSPLTSADTASNKIIISYLKKTKIPILSEELEDNLIRFKSEYVWIVDPLDGTKDFINQTGEFTVMIALAKKWENKKYRPILGLIYRPLGSILYYALEGEGAWVQHKNKKTEQLKVSRKSKNDSLIMLTSRNHSTDLEKEVSAKLNVNKIIRKGSSLKACFIAEGRGEFNFNPSFYTQEWDICASDIIIREAGGEFTDIKGGLIFYNKKNTANQNGYLISNKLAHKDVLKEIKNSGFTF